MMSWVSLIATIAAYDNRRGSLIPVSVVLGRSVHFAIRYIYYNTTSLACNPSFS